MLSFRARVLRVTFHLLYNEFAWSYDLVSWLVSLGQWRRWQRAALPFLPAADAGPVLELAHGPGHMLLALERSGYQIAGLDLSSSMGRQAQRRLVRHGRPAPLCRARAQALPFAGHAFAAVLSTFPAEFIVEPATLHEVHRVLRPDGRFVLVPLARLTGGDPISRLLEWLYVVTGQREPAQVIAEPSRPLWQPLLDAGFQVTTTEVAVPHSRVTVVVARKMA